MENQTKEISGVKINPNMPDYSKDPFFVEQLERAKASIDKYGLPSWELIEKLMNKDK